MYIEKIKIKNYRNFGNDVFELELKPFTLIIGENNIGKTNLLNAIGLILSPDISFYQKRNLEIEDINYQSILTFKNQVLAETTFENVAFPEVRVDLILNDFTKEQYSIVGDWHISDITDVGGIATKAKISYLATPNRLEDQKKWFVETKNLLKNISDSGKIPTIQNIDFPIHFYHYLIFGGDDTTKRIDFNWLNFFKMEFLDALRDAKSNLLAGGKNTLLYSILNTQTENKIPEIKTHLSELRELIGNNSSFKEIKDEIEIYLKKISGAEEEGLLSFQFTGVETSEMLKRLSLLYGSEPISIERNGLGRNNLLYISLLLSQLIKEADKKKVYFRIIGIEEPEAHLHPHLQVHLSRNIDTERSKERQLLITSHSTHITSQLSLEDTVVLYKDENKIKSCYLLNNQIPDVSKQYLQKYLDATKSTMFFARKIILVEGISEQLVIPELFKLYCDKFVDISGNKIHIGKSLEKFGISLLNVDSVAFEHFLRIIKSGYFIKCVVLTDSDKDNSSKHRVPALKRAYNSIAQIKIFDTEESTYEKDLIKSNVSDNGKEILLAALIKTRRNNGKKLKADLGINPIEIEPFFENIYKKTDKGVQNYKSEFSMNIVEVLKDLAFKDKRIDFKIPQYIEDGFNFLIR
jgi:predicted ATP-dependent endonuclease of OLD family